jgi:hypothetical protein
MRDWRATSERAAAGDGQPLKPQLFAMALGARLAPGAVVACDSGHKHGRLHSLCRPIGPAIVRRVRVDGVHGLRTALCDRGGNRLS